MLLYETLWYRYHLTNYLSGKDVDYLYNGEKLTKTKTTFVYLAPS
jgi:hypothetical protein